MQILFCRVKHKRSFYMMQVIDSRRLLLWVIITIVLIVVVLATTMTKTIVAGKDDGIQGNGVIWQPPDTSLIPFTEE